MNQDDMIYCAKCGTANPHGSRFCNSCGSALPDTDEIVCHNCQARNPKTNIYCDTCGARLVREAVEPDPVSPDTTPPATTPTSLLNLPIRDEGQTGDLDPNDLPDWLRTGSVPHEEETPDSGKLPRPSELTPAERPETADLPAWLVNATDANSPIIDTPADISTEQFVDLMGSDTQNDVDELGLFAVEDPRLEEDEADLPNWLQNDAPLDPPPDSQPAQPTTDDDVPDWLAAPNLMGSKEDDAALSETDFLASELAGWMNDKEDSGEAAQPAAANDEFDWLTNDADEATTEEDSLPDSDAVELDWLNQGTRLFEDDTSDEQPATADAAPQEDDLSWLNQGTRLFEDEQTAVSEPDTPSDNSMDWLHQGTRFFEDDASTQQPADDTEPTANPNDLDWLTQGTRLFEESQDDTADTPPDNSADWLSDLETPADDQPATPDPRQSSPADNLSLGTDTAEEAATPEFDWLNELSQEDSAPLNQADDLGAAAIFADLGEDASADDAASDFDWLDDLGDNLALEQEPTTAVSDDTNIETLLTDEAGEFDWLDEMEVEPDIVNDVDDTPAAQPEAAVDDWLSTLEETTATAEPTPIEPATTTPDDSGTGDLPDWISELGPPSTGALSEPEENLQESFSDFFTEDLPQDDILPDWFADTPDDASSSLATNDDLMPDLDWLTEEIAEPASPETAVSPSDTTPSEDSPPPEDEDEGDWQKVDANTLAAEPDWLSTLEGLDESVFDPEIEAALTAAEEEDSRPEPDDLSSDIEPHVLAYDFTQSQSAFDDDDDLASDDSWMTSSDIGDELPQSDLPDWLSELGDTEEESDDPEAGTPDPDLPDWINTMKPGETPQPSQYESIFSDEEDFSDLAESDLDLGDELEAAGLPEWLQTPTNTAGEDASTTNGQSAAAPLIDNPFGNEELIADDISTELTSVLADMPPPPQIESAEIPEWVLAMKPSDSALAGETTADGQPVQRTGPLAGIRGVVEIEPDIAKPHSSELPLAELAVTDAQQQQVALVRQLAQAEAKPLRVAQAEKITQSSSLLRLVVALLLLAAMALPLLGISPLPTATPTLSTPAEAALATLDEAAGQPILIVFDYPPAYSGELSPLAQTVLQRSAANNSSLLTISQLPAGTGLATAETAAYDTLDLGLLPGGAVGLRQLSTCLNQRSNCPLLMETLASNSNTAPLEQVGLIVLLTSERQSLINWVEQVNTTTALPLVAATTEALAPLTTPYVASGQVAGVWAGLPDSVALRAAIGAPTDALQQQLSGRTLGQLVALLVVLGGLLFYGFRRPTTGGRE